MGANKNSSIELGLYPKYHHESSLLARSSIRSYGELLYLGTRLGNSLNKCGSKLEQNAKDL